MSPHKLKKEKKHGPKQLGSTIKKKSKEKCDTAQEQYDMWRTDVYDKYNALKKTDILHSIDSLKKIRIRKKYSRVNDCKRNIETESDDTMWHKPGYILNHIRQSILKRDWVLVKKLTLLLSSNEKFDCYVKEVTFLLALMASDYDKRILDELKLCFCSMGKAREVSENPYDIWYVENI
nr:uncharacterized protein LOC111424545 [Onthophagus taurus]